METNLYIYIINSNSPAQDDKLCTNHMKLITTIEINEVETEVSIDFEMYFGDVEISKITDLETGNALGLEISDNTFNELLEYIADRNAVKNYTKFYHEF